MPTNRIQVKRSTANSVVSGLNPGELAFTANGNILYIGNPADGASLRIAGLQTPGTLTANQALVANATSGIDKVIVGTVTFTGTSQKVELGGSSGSAGQVLVSNGSANAYWSNPSALSAVNTAAAYTWTNTNTFEIGLNVGNSTILTLTNTAITYAGNTTTNPAVSIGTNGNIAIGNGTTTQTTSIVQLANSAGNSSLTPTTLKVGPALNVNTTQIVVSTSTGINANSSLGTAGQVLASNGTTVYWTNPSVGDITGVNAGAGLTSGGSTGEVTIDVGAGNGISVSADAVAVNLGANSGLIANTLGLFVSAGDGLATNSTALGVGAGNGITVSADAVAVNAGDGLLANATGVHVVAGNGVSVSADAVAVAVGNNQLIANTTGLWVDQSKIDHNSLSNYVVNRHIDHSAVTLTAGAGLSGGGDITTSRTFDVGAGNGITVGTDTVAVNANTNAGLVANATGLHAKVGSGLVFDGSGNIALSTSISVQDLTVSGNLSVLGDIVTMNVATLSVEDSLITLASGQATSATFTDALDLGFVGTYGNTANLFYSGLFRDQSDSGIWKLFASNGAVTNTNVDTTNATLFKLATLESFIKSNGLVSNATAVTLTANSTVAVNMTANTLTLSTPLAATSGGTGQSTFAVGDLLVGGATNTLAKLSLGTSGYVLQSNGTALVYDYLDGGTF